MCSVAAAAPALAAPRDAVPGPPGRPVAVARSLVEAARADRLADELRHVDAVVADDRGVGPGVGALHVVLAITTSGQCGLWVLLAVVRVLK